MLQDMIYKTPLDVFIKHGVGWSAQQEIHEFVAKFALKTILKSDSELYKSIIFKK